MPQTKLTNLINPEVMAPIISAKLPAKIAFSPIAAIDRTLEGKPGNTITVPKYAYIGDAEDVAEGVAMGTTILTATSTEVTVKKAGKAIELTDESVLSGYGDPVGQANGQIAMSLGSKVDADCHAALENASLVFDGSSAIINYAGIVDAAGLLQEEGTSAPKVMFVHPDQVTSLRKSEDFKDIHRYPLQTVMTGVIGEISGCQVLPSKRVAKIDLGGGVMGYKDIIVNTTADEDDPAALTIYLKRDVSLETDRTALAGTTTLVANQHYTAALSNDSKVVIAKFMAETQTGALTSVTEVEEVTEVTEVNPHEMTHKELVTYAKDKGLDIKGNASKEEIIALLEV